MARWNSRCKIESAGTRIKTPMRKAILDSDILSEIGKGINVNVLRNASRYLDEHDQLTFTSISVYEVLYGLKAKPATKQAIRFEALLEDHEEIFQNRRTIGSPRTSALHCILGERPSAKPIP